MPYRRVSQGFAVIALVAIAAMIVVGFISSRENTTMTVAAVLGFGASTIAGVLAILRKLEQIIATQGSASGRIEDVHDLVSHRAALINEITELRQQVTALKGDPQTPPVSTRTEKQ